MTLFQYRKENLLFWGWVLIVLSLGSLFYVQLKKGLRFETNILELLPKSDEDRVFETIRTSFQGTMGRTVLILLEQPTESSSDQKSLDKIRNQLRNTLESSDVFRIVRASDRSWGRSLYDLYFPYRYQILAPSVRKKLKSSDPVLKLRQNIVRRLHSHSITRYSDILDRDPLLLFPELVQYWQKQQASAPSKKSDQNRKHQTVLIGRLDRDPLKKDTQVQVRKIIEQCRSRLNEIDSDVSFRWSGLVRFAMVSRNNMQKDARFIGLISIAGVILLVISTFRSLKQLFLLVTTVFIGLLTAVSISQIFFDLHVITMAFGASLIGICVDYAFHYFSEYRLRSASWSSWKGLQNIFPGIFLGWFTSVLAFGSLSLTPMPALKQMSLFTCLGLTGAFLTVVCVYPPLFRVAPVPDVSESFRTASFWNPAFYLVDGLLGFWNFRKNNPVLRVARWSSGAILAILIISGLPFLQFNDHIKNLDPVPEWLIQNDRYIQRAAGLHDTGRYVLLQSDTRQSLLKKQEAVQNVLNTLRKNNVYEQSWSLYPFLPSIQRQKHDRSLLKTTILSNREKVRSMLKEHGHKKSTIKNLFTELDRANPPMLTPKKWKNHPASFGLSQLWLGERNKRFSSLIILQNIRNESRLKRKIEQFQGVFFRNRARKFNQLLLDYRQLAMNLTGIAYLVITLLLLFRYGFLQAMLTILPAAGGSLFAIALLSISGVTLNMMHLLALLLLLGMGIDYAVFLAETHRMKKSVRPSILALVLSALTTVLSFGCLAFSPSRVIQSIGSMVFPGILMILFLSPVVYYGMEYLSGNETPN